MVEFVIRLTDAGQCEVGGPIHDKVLTYGTLAAAADVVREYHEKKAQARVQLATADAVLGPTSNAKIV